ncbi:uncharacterized protein [Elaeis guineensis]|uniref:uncharacterized protein n=1 Tax=Elaeis guineensis var. tenera TaxID=51953 RepID=UPI003C6CDD5F
MERRGGCCIAKYGGKGGGDYRADVAWKVGRIMLRFRPIAPKPPAAAPVAPAAAAEMRTAGRAKRKAGGGGGGRGREGRRGRKARKIVTGAFKEETGAFKEEKEEKMSSSSESSAAGSGTTVTLSLMPETPERKDDAPPVEIPAVSYVIPAWLRAREGGSEGGGGGGGEVVAPRPVRPAGSWVTVECVTDKWRDGEVGASTTGGDEAVRAALAADQTGPGFISDAWDRVTWTNEAYRRMVVGPGAEDGKEEGTEEEDVRVALATRGMVPGATCRAFTCRVRVRYASRRRGRGSLAAPCDVWRMDDGGYAWRLDVKAALSLSLGR